MMSIYAHHEFMLKDWYELICPRSRSGFCSLEPTIALNVIEGTRQDKTSTARYRGKPNFIPCSYKACTSLNSLYIFETFRSVRSHLTSIPDTAPSPTVKRKKRGWGQRRRRRGKNARKTSKLEEIRMPSLSATHSRTHACKIGFPASADVYD